jgi:signal transduction histidine kinase
VDERGQQFLEIATNCANLMLFLMSDILDFAQIEAKSFVLNITRCNIEDLLHDCLNVFKLKAQEKNLELNVQFENSEVPDH